MTWEKLVRFGGTINIGAGAELRDEVEVYCAV
jgi:hypothetical protein